jgi:hypothetical protein
MSFPTIVYRCPGMHQRPGGTYDYLAIESEEELADAIKDGWFKTLPEAMGEKSAPKIVAEEPSNEGSVSRAELEEMATSLKIKFDGRTTDKSLTDKIDRAMK